MIIISSDVIRVALLILQNQKKTEQVETKDQEMS
jgi:hypothetical protein